MKQHSFYCYVDLREKGYWSKYLWRWVEFVKLNAKESVHKHYTIVDEAVPHWWVNHSDTTIHVHQNLTIKLMDESRGAKT